MATQATLEQCNSGEDRGHSGAGDGMEPAFFLGGVSSNTCKENQSLVLVPSQKTQVQKCDGCTVTISCNIANERTSFKSVCFIIPAEPKTV